MLVGTLYTIYVVAMLFILLPINFLAVRKLNQGIFPLSGLQGKATNFLVRQRNNVGGKLTVIFFLGFNLSLWIIGMALEDFLGLLVIGAYAGVRSVVIARVFRLSDAKAKSFPAG